MFSFNNNIIVPYFIHGQQTHDTGQKASPSICESLVSCIVNDSARSGNIHEAAVNIIAWRYFPSVFIFLASAIKPLLALDIILFSFYSDFYVFLQQIQMRLTANEAHTVCVDIRAASPQSTTFFFYWNVRDLKRVCVYIIIYSLQLQSLTQLEMKKREIEQKRNRLMLDLLYILYVSIY